MRFQESGSSAKQSYIDIHPKSKHCLNFWLKSDLNVWEFLQQVNSTLKAPCQNHPKCDQRPVWLNCEIAFLCFIQLMSPLLHHFTLVTGAKRIHLSSPHQNSRLKLFGLHISFNPLDTVYDNLMRRKILPLHRSKNSNCILSNFL